MPYRITERAQQRRAARRSRLLAVARQLFETQGYQATTMQQVVREAGTSIGNLYFYFPNKSALLRAVIDEDIEAIERQAAAAVGDLPLGPQWLARRTYAGVLAALERAALVRVWLVETGEPELRTAVFAHFASRTQDFLCQTPELLGGLPVDLAAHAWQGAIFQVIESVAAGTLPVDPPATARFLARWNLQALGLSPDEVEVALAGLEPPA